MDYWKDDKKWSDKCLPEVKRILGLYLIGEANRVEDQEHNTDLIVLELKAVRIAVRIRRSKFYTRQFREEFTIRSGRPGGTKTELAKIIEGWGDYFFYGFASEDGSNLIGWTLLTLNDFRSYVSVQMTLNKGEVPGYEMPNYDGSSSFRIFRWDVMPNGAIMGQSLPPLAEDAVISPRIQTHVLTPQPQVHQPTVLVTTVQPSVTHAASDIFQGVRQNLATLRKN